MIPQGAIFEDVIAGGIALYDVSHLLKKHPTKRARRRDPSKITRLYVHHSGADDPHTDGYAAMSVSASYVVGVRDFPCFAYTFWLSRKADRDEENRIVVYRGNHDAVRSWHTGLLANGHGVAAALEGDTTQQGLTSDQVEALEGFVPWCAERYPKFRFPKGLSGHWEAWKFGGRRKASCPGQAAKDWIFHYREEVSFARAA